MPAGIENAVKQRLLIADQFLANIVVGDAKEAEACLAEPLKRLLLIGPPNEHVLQVSYNEAGLPDSASKHLLGIL